MKRIVVHSGQAHRDDFLSASLALFLQGSTYIVRRDPTPEELADPAVLVLDVGMSHDPALSNYDHHQLPEDTVECAFSLYTDAFFTRENNPFRKLPWFEPTVRLDATGTVETARALGLSRIPQGLRSPLEGWLLKRFSQETSISPESELGSLMYDLGKSLAEEADNFATGMTLLGRAGQKTLKGLLVLHYESNKVTSDVLGAFLSRNRGYAVVINWDDRGSGWSMLRVKDHPQVDFRRIEGDARIKFVHTRGFVAKTLERIPLEEVFALVAGAIDESR